MAVMSCNLVSKSAIGTDSDDKFDGNFDGMMIDEGKINHNLVIFTNALMILYEINQLVSGPVVGPSPLLPGL